MATGLHLWSRTAATNATADSSINWAEGQAPSSVNDSARALMARVAEWRDDLGGVTTGGTSTAYTVTTNRGFASAAVMDKQIITIIPHATSGADPTLAVDGMTARQIRTATGVNVTAGTLVAGTPYALVYFHAATEFILLGFEANPYSIPLGAALPYFGASAPTSSFALAFGQAISRTTYANLFNNVFGTFYGGGDGSTTFNLPDMRGRVPAGADNMGGSAASRLTNDPNGFGTPAGLGAVGGAEKTTLVEAHLPVVTPTGSVSIIDPGHNHSGLQSAGAYGAGINTALQAGGSGTVSMNTTGITASFSGAPFGSSVGHTNVQPTICANYIIRII